MLSIRALLVLLTFSAVFSERRRYDGYQMFEVTPINKAQMNQLGQMEANGDIEILKHPSIQGPGLILVPASRTSKIPTHLVSQNFAVKLINEDVQVDIDREYERLDARYAIDPYNFDLNDYNRLEAIYQQYYAWEAACPSGLTCELINIGSTYEGRGHIVFKIGKTGAKNKALFLESILHSREWLAVATELQIINHLITRYGSDPEVTKQVDKYDWYFLPVGNPDGYAFSWDSDRFWRKNRRDPFPGAWCTGTDLNRNFEAYFGREGASPDICAQTYPGPGPNSEPETQNIVQFTRSLSQRQDIVTHMCIHTSGNMWMFPYGHTLDHAGRQCARTRDHADLTRVTNAAVTALEDTHGTWGSWRKGTICEVIYPATGDEISFAYDILKVKYAFALELRGRGFVVDKSQIPLSFSEIWNALGAMIREIEQIEGY